ncbi:MAG: sigma-70 family RNA polymerase sigma factor [Dehalococcoidia bacterium]
MVAALQTKAEAWESFIESASPASRDQLIIEHAALVKYVIGRLSITLPATVDYEDLVAFGTIGLIQALDRFDSTLGVKFESFAVMRIRGSILDALRAHRGVPKSLREKGRAIQQAAAHFERTFGRSASDADLGGALGLSAAEVQRRRRDAACMSVSLELELEANPNAHPAALASQHPDDDVQGTAERNETLRELAGSLKTLNEREQILLNLYYAEELTMREIGGILGVSEGRVCQLHARALQKLRIAMTEQPAPLARVS